LPLSGPTIKKFDSPEKLAGEAADLIVKNAEKAIGKRRIFTLVLPGGRSPVPLFKFMAREEFRRKFPWNRTHIFWGDERCLPLDHPDSNFRLAETYLLKSTGIATKTLHPMPVSLPPDEGALAYRGEVSLFFREKKLPPRFDCIILGMGSDGHTASIFPDELPRAETREVFAASGEKGSPPVPRISLGYPLILTARQILLIAPGEEKEKAIHRASTPEGRNLPVARILASPNTIVLSTC